MKTTKYSLVAGMILAGLLAGASLGYAQDAKADKQGDRRGGPMIQQRLDRMSEELKLTEEQKTKIKAAFEAEAKKRQEMRGEAASTPEARRERFQAMREEMSKKMKEILTPEQFAKWEKMRQQAGPDGQRGEGKGKAEGKKGEGKRGEGKKEGKKAE
jgi:Spy/CpxP family protein refolding chaperone